MYQTIAKSIFGELPYKPLVPNYTLFTLTPLLFHGGKGKRTGTCHPVSRICLILQKSLRVSAQYLRLLNHGQG